MMLRCIYAMPQASIDDRDICINCNKAKRQATNNFCSLFLFYYFTSGYR